MELEAQTASQFMTVPLGVAEAVVGPATGELAQINDIETALERQYDLHRYIIRGRRGLARYVARVRLGLAWIVPKA